MQTWSIITIILLSLSTIAFFIAWIIAQLSLTNQITCQGDFGTLAGYDSPIVNLCGSSSKDPCFFSVPSLSAAVNQCNLLSSICQAFSYNPSINQMKIVTGQNIYSSPAINLFIRNNPK